MTTYTVHLHRDIRLTFEGIEANSLEAALRIARDGDIRAAAAVEDSGEDLSARVETEGGEGPGPSVTIPFEPERQRQVASRLRSALEYAIEFLTANDDGEEDVGSRLAVATAALTEADAAGIASDPAVAASAMYDALVYVAEMLSGFKPDFLANIGLGIALEKTLAALHAAEAMQESAPPSATSDSAKTPYSVLLLYPDDMTDGGTETFYAWVEATDPSAAVAEARQQALAANEWDDMSPGSFVPLLVIEGHHYGQPIV